MIHPSNYDSFVTRNSGYISEEAQNRIRACKLLIAGCGIGSSPAICAARMGFEEFTLVDGDTVDIHNLNRQFYEFSDIGRRKVDALKNQILRINPEAKVNALPIFLDDQNIDQLVKQSDVVFDTVDFLDLRAIMALHQSASNHRVHILTALSTGFGALVWNFPPGSKITLIDILAGDLEKLAERDPSNEPSYADVFARFIQRLAPYLDVDVVEQVARVLALMKEGKPCPASQVAVGSFAIGAMAMSMIHDQLSNPESGCEPELIIHSFKRHQTTRVTMESLRV